VTLEDALTQLRCPVSQFTNRPALPFRALLTENGTQRIEPEKVQGCFGCGTPSFSLTASGTTVPPTSRRCEPPWRKRRGEPQFGNRFGAAGNGGQTVAKEIPREELKARQIRGDFVLVEAFSRRHYESSHLLGAINLRTSLSTTWRRSCPTSVLTYSFQKQNTLNSGSAPW
jgi:hypothetical protein